MTDEKDRTNDTFDLDEIDELPDVVLGEKTRTMRVIRDQNKSQKNDEKENQKSDLITDLNDQKAKTDVDQIKEKSEDNTNTLSRIDRQFESLQKNKSTNKDADNSSDKKPENSIHADEKKQEKDSSPEYHNDNEDDDEIPASVIDDDPGIVNELDEALKPKKSRHDETDPLPPVSDELSKVYSGSDATAVKGKHVAHTEDTTEKQKVTDTQQILHSSGTAAVVSAEKVQDTSETEKTDNIRETETASSKKKKKRRVPLAQRIVTVILIILLILLAIGIYGIYSSLQPVTDHSEPVSFQVNDGETIGEVTSALAKEGIIRDARTGYYYARLTHLTDVKRGVFQLDKSWPLKKLFTNLNDDKAADQDAVIVTLTEGDWAKDMADKISSSTNVKSDDLMALWNNDDYIKKNLMPKYPFLTNDILNENIKCDLEGYLAPDTYTFNKETTAEEVTAKILNQSAKIYDKYADQIKNSGYTVHQIYTLASIVQGESSREDQMKRIAGVFYNRLKQDMPLQSSVTTCYIIDFSKGKTSWQECEASYNTSKQDPYNTYQNKGLPPGPVQNPGEAAINAVLNPEKNDYLFFMADVCGNTGIHYAKTQAEHEANVAKYNTCN